MENGQLLDRLKEMLLPFIAEQVRAEFYKQVRGYEPQIDMVDSPVYVGVAEACRVLKVSRQTLYNWEKGRCRDVEIGVFIKKIAGRKLYDAGAIRTKLEMMSRCRSHFLP